MLSKSQMKLNLLLTLAASLTSLALIECATEPSAPTRPLFRFRERANARQNPQAPPVAPISATGSVVEVVASPAVVSSTSSTSRPIVASQAVSSNRTVRLAADVFQNGDGYNIFVTNTCERDSMKVNIKTSRPFYGVIHTRNQRQKPTCSVEGDGNSEYNLEISHVLNSQDPAYCGVIRARRDSPQDKDSLSVVVAVRVHRSIELSDDKFFLLNCTNRCRKPDCSSPSAKLSDAENESGDRNGRIIEEETDTNTNVDAPNQVGRERENGNQPDECTIYKFPWLISLLWCLAILCLAMMISHCIMCSSLVCRCVRREVEETEPSVYEGATDFEDDQYNKRHPFRIDYDNRDVYKTSNNYAPYTLEEAQTKSRQKTHKKSLG